MGLRCSGYLRTPGRRMKQLLIGDFTLLHGGLWGRSVYPQILPRERGHTQVT